jgi:hypothetical protein
MYNINGHPILPLDVNGLDLVGNIALAADPQNLAIAIVVGLFLLVLLFCGFIVFMVIKAITRKKPTH